MSVKDTWLAKSETLAFYCVSQGLDDDFCSSVEYYDILISCFMVYHFLNVAYSDI